MIRENNHTMLIYQMKTNTEIFFIYVEKVEEKKYCLNRSYHLRFKMRN